MDKPIVYMFSGQGSHYYQMGRELFDRQPLFKSLLQTADSIYQDITGLSIIETLYDTSYKKSDPFTQTLLTHPAIFIIQHTLGQLLLAQGIPPDYVLGTSLGEFNAAVFAGILSFENALIAVVKQAKLLEMRCPKGGMLAILASPELYVNSTLLQTRSALAACNFHSHFVVSCSLENLLLLEEYLAKQSISFQRLAVSHAFHSSHIDQAAADYQNFINQQTLHPAKLPFISCTKTSCLIEISPNHFWDCIRQPIQFQTTLETLEKKDSYYYLDVGPSGTLATFVQYNLGNSSSQSFRLMTPYGEDWKQFMKIIEQLKVC